MSFFGAPSNTPFQMHQEDPFVPNDMGGRVVAVQAAETLLFGDAVYLNFGGRAAKSLESSAYTARFLGIVVGGQNMSWQVSNDILNIGDTMATVGQLVYVQVSGCCYAIADATGINSYTPITAGRTTAGRVIGDQATSYTDQVAGMAIKAGGSVLAKSVNVFTPTILGVNGTATAANLDGAALSGTTANGKFAVYVFRVAADGTTVTTAKSADADSLSLLLWPTGSAILCTYAAVIINPTGTGNFVGNTTALDDATVVPNAKYINLTRNRSVIGYAVEAGGAAGTAVKIMLRP